MRYVGAVITPVLVCGALFASCTCHQDVEPPPPMQEPHSGFHAALPTRPKPTPQVRVQARTPTQPAVAAAAGTPGPVAAVPEDFPKDVPIYKDATVTQVQKLANNAHNVIFSSAAPLTDVFNFYQDSMGKGGWKVTQQFQRPNHAFMSFQKGNMIANLTVAEDVHHPGQQVIAIMYEEQQPLDFDEF
jgi:hypothetical protein